MWLYEVNECSCWCNVSVHLNMRPIKVISIEDIRILGDIIKLQFAFVFHNNWREIIMFLHRSLLSISPSRHGRPCAYVLDNGFPIYCALWLALLNGRLLQTHALSVFVIMVTHSGWFLLWWNDEEQHWMLCSSIRYLGWDMFISGAKASIGVIIVIGRRWHCYIHISAVAVAHVRMSMRK